MKQDSTLEISELAPELTTPRKAKEKNKRKQKGEHESNRSHINVTQSAMNSIHRYIRQPEK